MEIREYLQMLKKNMVFFVISIILFALIGYFITSSQPYDYQSSTAIEFSRYQSQKQSDVPYFQYDNFYASEVSAAISDNMIGFLSSASTVSEIFNKAGYEIPTTNLRSLGKTFIVKKKVNTSAVIDISYSSKDKEKAGRLVKSASEVVKEKVEQYNESDKSAYFVARADEPVIIAAPKQTVLNAIIAGFIGLLLAWGIVSVKESIKK